MLIVSGLVFAAALGLLGAGLLGAVWLLRPPRMSMMTVFPERFGLPYEPVTLTACDGHPLAGWFVPSPTGRDETLLVLHGWGDNRGEVLERTLFLNKKEGYNLLYIDFRGHGQSGPSVVTMGKLELRDVKGAVAWLRRHKPRCAAALGLFGQSMGASVGAMALAENPEFRAAVLESPFADYHLIAWRWAYNYCKAPDILVIDLVLMWARLLSGHRDIADFSPEKRIGGSACPALLLAGENDALMPPEDVRRVFDAARGPKELWVVPGARHARCLEAAPEEYERRVGEFLRRYLLPVQGLDKRIGTLQ